MKNIIRIARQLLKEFWFPLLAAAAFTAYRYFETPVTARAAFSVIDTFGARVFFFVWLLGQFFRVVKQHAVEDTLSKIEGRVDQTMKAIEARTARIMETMTGGDSECMVSVYPVEGSNWVHLSLMVKGTSPMPDVTVTVSRVNGLSYDHGTMENFRCEILSPPLAVESSNLLHPFQFYNGQRFQCPGNEFDLRIQVSAKNGLKTSYMRYRYCPDGVFKWLARQVVYEPPTQFRETYADFDTREPWPTARAMTVAEFEARSAA